MLRRDEHRIRGGSLSPALASRRSSRRAGGGKSSRRRRFLARHRADLRAVCKGARAGRAWVSAARESGSRSRGHLRARPSSAARAARAAAAADSRRGARPHAARRGPARPGADRAVRPGSPGRPWPSRGRAGPQEAEIPKHGTTSSRGAPRRPPLRRRPLSLARNPIDNFSRARKRKGSGVDRGRPRLLIRRVSLTSPACRPARRGRRFVDDRGPTPTSNCRRMLASPHYGERWARTGSTWAATPTPTATRRSRAIMWVPRRVIEALNATCPSTS